MATQGTFEGGSNTNKERRTPNGAKTQGGYAGRPASGKTYKQDGQNRFSRAADGQAHYSRSADGQKRYSRPEGDRPRNGRPEGTGSSRFNKTEGGFTKKPFDRNKNYSSSPKFSGKDEDEEDNSRRSKSFRPKENKPSVSILDKNKLQIRIEKEQKSMMKKQQNKKKESNRPQPKVKRANNVNYTRNYANGDYDDYYDM